MSFQQEVGEAMVGEAAAANHLDLEAAEQLIQLSGGDGDGADDGGSESRSADSVKFCGADQAGIGMKEKEKEEEVAVESRRRKRSTGRFVAGKESAVESWWRGAAWFQAEKNGAGVVDEGEERRRPRFRWLADVYRETRQLATREWRAAGGPDPHPEADRRRKKRKGAADADEEVVRGRPRSAKGKQGENNGGIGM